MLHKEMAQLTLSETANMTCNQQSQGPTADQGLVQQEMPQPSMNETQNQSVNVRSRRQAHQSTTEPHFTQQEIDTLVAQTQDVKARVTIAEQRTLELKGAIRVAFNLSFDLEVWEQIPIDEQMEFGKLERAVSGNDSWFSILNPMIATLPGLLEMRDFGTVEAKLWMIEPCLPKVEENVLMVVKKLEERALAKRVCEMSLE